MQGEGGGLRSHRRPSDVRSYGSRDSRTRVSAMGPWPIASPDMHPCRVARITSVPDADVIMFVRHGEKPGDDGTPRGVDHDGGHDPHSLSVRGWTRAGGLAALLAQAPDAAHPDLATPARIIATKADKDYASKREVATATPLAERLGLPVDETFVHGDEQVLAASILTGPTPCFVVWHHGALPDVLRHLPISNPDDVPSHWPGDEFDRIWVLTREPGESAYRFSITLQALLGGDELAS